MKLAFVPKTWRDRYEQVPARYKAMCFILWVGWKFVFVGILWYCAQTSSSPKQQQRMLCLVTAPSRTETFTSTIARSIANLEQQFDVDVNWIVDDNNDERFVWGDAMPMSGSLYRQERFVVKDAFLFYDMFVALYDEQVVLTLAMVEDYLELSQQLSAHNANIEIEYLPYVGIQETQTSQMDALDHPLLGPSRIIHLDHDVQHKSNWGWMATRQQILQLYRENKFHLPPFDDNIAGNDDDLYVQK